MSGCAWVTLATNDTYCLGALVLAHSLKKVSTRHQLAIIITPQVSPSMREQLSKVFDVVQLVDVLDSQDAANLALLQRPDLGVTFTKIHCWNLTQYSRCVFLDADTLVIQNCDELMEREELSAAPDPGWPDCFNSGVFVFAPSQETFKQLIQFASTHGSFDGGDQGLLNMYFNDWPTSDIRKHLSFLYNMCSTSTYTYLPALKYYGANIKIVHFIGANKPWLLGPSGAGMSSFSQAWWDMFQSYVVQHLSKDMREYCPSWSDTTVASSFQSGNTSLTNDKSSLIQKTNPPRYKFTDPWENVSGKTKNKPQNLPPDKNIQKPALANHVKYNVITELPKISYYPLKSNLGSESNHGNDSLLTDNRTTTTSYNYLKYNTFQRSKKNEDFNNKENIVNVPQPNRHQNYVYRLSDSKKDETVNEKFKCVIQTPAEIASLFKTTGRLNDFNPTNPENVKNATVCGFNTNDARNSNSAGCPGSQSNSGLAGALGSKERSAIEEQWRKQNWEQGNIDFTGKDSFENIWQKIMDAVNKPKVESPKPVQALVPKEIASQAISEKEKADIPASEAAKEEEKAAGPQEARTPVPEEVKKDIAPLPVASAPAELPKVDQKPLTPEVPKQDQPIPIPPPTPEKADIPKLPESTKPLETLGSSAPESKEAPPSTGESPKPVEPSKKPETLPPVQAAEEPVVQMQAAVAQQEPAKVDEPKLDLAGDLPKIEDILKGLEQTLLAEQITGEQKESNIMPLDQPKIEDILKGLEQTLLAELPKDSKISPLEIPKMPTEISQAPEEQKKVEESQAPPPPVPAQASAPGTPQAPLPEVPKTDAPLPEIPKPETPSSKAAKAEEPKPQAPEAPAKQQPEAPMTPAPLPEVPTTPAPLPEVPTIPTSQPEVPTTPVSLPEVPKTPASQPEAPMTPAPLPEIPMTPAPLPEVPMTPAPLPEALKTPAAEPEVPKTEAPTQAETGASEVPKPVEAPKQSTPEAQKVEAVQHVPVETPLPAPDAPTPLAQTKPETVSAVPAPSETKEATTESKTDEGKKQKEGQKPAKQQAPQPPPKNGKQKKGQQPEPTSAHPLADAPVQAEAGKEEQKAAPQVPLTPPTSPDAQVKEPEAQVKASEPQPGTPIITAPTPPVTPADAFKVEDPLSAQIKSDEAVPATGSSGGADAPVPPKRKGKANEKQPPKPQNNGGKGKGKK